MSYPSDLSEEEKARWEEAMRRPVEKGTIIHEDCKRYKILEDTTAHGCPFVIEVDSEGNEIGKKFAKTLYLHYREMRDR